MITCSISLSVGGEPLKEPPNTTVTFLFPTIAAVNTATIPENELSWLLVILYHPTSSPPPPNATVAFLESFFTSIPVTSTSLNSETINYKPIQYI